MIVAEPVSRPLRARPPAVKTADPGHIIDWRSPEILRGILTDQPQNWHRLFGNDHPIDLEIGIGNGSFLVPYCAGHPERNMAGVEIEGYYVKKANRRLTREGLTNGRLLIGDAKLLVWKLFDDESIENVFINYPDPWFKRRHAKRRMVNMETLRLLARKMRGTLTIATDDEEYRDWVLESIREAGCFEPLMPGIFTTELAGHYPTKYEKKWKSLGKSCYYMQFRRSGKPELDLESYAVTQNLHFALKKISVAVARMTMEL